MRLTKRERFRIVDFEDKSREELINEIVYLREVVETQNGDENHFKQEDIRSIFRNIIEHLPALVYVKDTEHRFIMANEAVARHMGALSGKHLLGKTDHDFYDRLHADEYREYERIIMDTGIPQISRDEPVVKDGQTIKWILSTKIPMQSETGVITGIIGVSLDITERKRMEKERNNAITDLKKALAEVRTLSGLLPICASCKKIRDDEGYWHRLECYLQTETHVQLTHGFCPECAERTIQEYKDHKDQQSNKT